MSKIASTPQFLLFCEKADTYGFNRRADTPLMKALIDPDGRHVVVMHSLVQDNPPVVRCLWLVKFRDDSEPHRIELDMELERFNRLEEFEVPPDEEEEEVFT